MSLYGSTARLCNGCFEHLPIQRESDTPKRLKYLTFLRLLATERNDMI